MLLLVVLSLSQFVSIDGFSDLDAIASPFDFGFLLICSDDTEANQRMAELIVEGIEESSIPLETDIKLYMITVNSSGYSEIAQLAGSFGGYPAVVTLVGHCGFLELDTSMLSAEMEDAWFRWGAGGTSGICNHCRRCHP